MKFKDSISYSYLTDFTKFNDWSSWYEMEPNAKTEISGHGGQVDLKILIKHKTKKNASKEKSVFHLYILSWKMLSGNNF